MHKCNGSTLARRIAIVQDLVEGSKATDRKLHKQFTTFHSRQKTQQKHGKIYKSNELQLHADIKLQHKQTNKNCQSRATALG
jgi:hypothetical protein